MVMQGELTVVHKIGQGLGEFLGGAKLAGQKKQPEGTPTTMGMAGGLGMKALLGSEGFGGLKKQMVGMSGPIGKMAGGMMKGGIIGVAMGGISAIQGILTKALGSSSIFTGVAAQFWKIAGVMVDMLLMPLLPHMMKFIQWMMTSVMPQVLKLSVAIGKALNGDIGALLSALGDWYRFVFMDIYAKVLNSFGRFLLDIIAVSLKNAFTRPWSDDQTLKEYRSERKQKEQIASKKSKEESIGVEPGSVKEAWNKDQKNMGILPTAMIIKIFKLMNRDFKDIGKNMEEQAQVSQDITSEQKKFGEGMIKNARGSEKRLAAYVDKEKNVGKAWWKQWDLGLWGNSTLPNIKKNTQGYLETLAKETETSSDGLFSWIGSINWGIFGTIGTSIKNAASAVFGSIKGFFTGKDSDGKAVTPSIMSILPGLPEFPSLTEFASTLLTNIKDAGKKVFGAIKGFFTGKDAEGGDVKPSISSILPGLPDLSGILKTLTDIPTMIINRAKDMFHAVKGFFTGEGTTNPGEWKGASIFSILPDVPKLDEIITSMIDIAGTIKQKALDIWAGVKKWFTVTLPGMIPGIGSFSKEMVVELPMGGLSLEKVAGTGILGELEKVIGSAMDVAGKVKAAAKKIWDGVVTFFTVTLPGKVPTWTEVKGKVEEVWADFTADPGAALKEWASNLWGSWSEKTGIAGAIPKMLEKLTNLDIMGSLGNIFKINIKGDAQELLDAYYGLGNRGTFVEQDSGVFDLEVGIGDMIAGLGSMIKAQAMKPIDWIKEKYNDLTTFLSGISITDFSWDGILGSVKAAVNGIINFINEKICSIFNSYNEMTFGPFSIPSALQISNVWKIPTWHTGGIVPGGPGTQVPAMLQGGEQVIPRSQRQNQGGGGGTSQVFNISINSSYSPGDIIKSIAQSGATDEVAYLNTVG